MVCPQKIHTDDLIGAVEVQAYLSGVRHAGWAAGMRRDLGSASRPAEGVTAPASCRAMARDQAGSDGWPSWRELRAQHSCGHTSRAP